MYSRCPFNSELMVSGAQIWEASLCSLRSSEQSAETPLVSALCVSRPCPIFGPSSPSYQPSARHLSCSSSNLSIFNFHCHFHIHRLCRSISPSPPLITPPSAQGCQSFRDPVSCEIAQIAVALRLARQQRGERQRKRKRKRERERDFLLQHFWTWIAPLPRCPFLPLFTQTWTSTRTAARLHIYPLQPKYLPPAHTHTHTHTHPTSSPPPSPPPPPLSMWPHHRPRHPHGKDTSTTLLQCAGHFTEQLDESLQSSRGIKPLSQPEESCRRHLHRKEQSPATPSTRNTHTHTYTHTHMNRAHRNKPLTKPGKRSQTYMP